MLTARAIRVPHPTGNPGHCHPTTEQAVLRMQPEHITWSLAAPWAEPMVVSRTEWR